MTENNEKLSSSRLAEKALQEAVKEALAKHAKMGVPAVIMRDGKMCYRMPDGRILDNPEF